MGVCKCITHSSLSCNISSPEASRVVADLLFVSFSSLWASDNLFKKGLCCMSHYMYFIACLGCSQLITSPCNHASASPASWLRLTRFWQLPTAGGWSTAPCPTSASHCHGRQRAPWSFCPFPLTPEDDKHCCSAQSQRHIPMLRNLSDLFISRRIVRNVTWISCRLVSFATEGLAIEKQVPSQGSRRILRVSTPA